MPLSTVVNLPRKHAAKFLSRCIRCGTDPADGTVRLSTQAIGWWTWVFCVAGRGFTAYVPACAGCRWRIRFQRVGSLVVALAVFALLLFLAWPYLNDLVARPLRKWVAMGLMLVCFSPFCMWEVFFPPSIDITAYSESVDYEFRDADYAYEFAELNDGAEWVKIK